MFRGINSTINQANTIRYFLMHAIGGVYLVRCLPLNGAAPVCLVGGRLPLHTLPPLARPWLPPASPPASAASVRPCRRRRPQDMDVECFRSTEPFLGDADVVLQVGGAPCQPCASVRAAAVAVCAQVQPSALSPPPRPPPARARPAGHPGRRDQRPAGQRARAAHLGGGHRKDLCQLAAHPEHAHGQPRQHDGCALGRGGRAAVGRAGPSLRQTLLLRSLQLPRARDAPALTALPPSSPAHRPCSADQRSGHAEPAAQHGAGRGAVCRPPLAGRRHSAGAFQGAQAGALPGAGWPQPVG